jgi:formylglycine-generating enzyme required for sulfatase activity/predicted MPP superfamily phosphohydrolase
MTTDPQTLFQQIRTLNSAQLDELTLLCGADPAHLSGTNTPPSTRAIELIRYHQQPGRSLDALAQALHAVLHPSPAPPPVVVPTPTPASTTTQTTGARAMSPAQNPAQNPAQAQDQAPTERDLVWLHLTDLHRKGRRDDALWPSVKEALWRALADPPEERLKAVDVVIFSGDLAFSGAKAQYEEVKTFLGELRAKLKKASGKDVPVFAVPGNHDLARPTGRDARSAAWLYDYTDPDCLATLWGSTPNEELDAIRATFKDWSEFQRDTIEATLENSRIKHGLMPGDARVELDLNGFKLGLVGLNSAWRQVDGRDFRNRITLDRRQLEAVCPDLGAFKKRNHLTLLVQHHPPQTQESARWIADQRTWQGTIEAEFDLGLFGHLHENEVEAVAYNGGKMVRRAQARSLFGVEAWGQDAATHPRHFGFAWGHAKAQGRAVKLKLWPQHLVEHQGGWYFKMPHDMGSSNHVQLPDATAGDDAEGDLAGSAEDGRPLRWELKYLEAQRPSWDMGLYDAFRALNEGAEDRMAKRSKLYVPLKAEAGLCWLDKKGALQIAPRQEDAAQPKGKRKRAPQPPEDVTSEGMLGQGGERGRPFLEQVLSQAALPHLVVEGDPGSGKTVLLQHLAHVLASHHACAQSADQACPGLATVPGHRVEWDSLRAGGLAPVPILIEGRRIEEAAWPTHPPAPGAPPPRPQEAGAALVLEAVRRHLHQKTAAELSADDLHKAWDAGRHWLLVDSLDEVPGEEGPKRVYDSLVALAKLYPKLRLTLTTRPKAYTGVELGDVLRRVHIAPMEWEQAEQMIQRWCHEQRPDDATYRDKLTLAVKLSSSRDETHFAQNPMFLTSAFLVYEEENSLPDNLADLYHGMVRVLCRTRNNAERPELTRDRKRELLELVARTIQEHGGTVCPERKVAQHVCARFPDTYKDLDDAATLLTLLGNETGLLRFAQPPQGSSGRHLRFWHRSVQEFLCACALTAMQSTTDSIDAKVHALFGEADTPHGFKPDWRGVMQLMVGAYGRTKHGEAQLFLDAVHRKAQTPDLAPARRARLLGIVAWGLIEYKHHLEGFQARATLPQEIVDRFRQEGRAWPIEDRLWVLEALGRLGDPRLDRAQEPWWRDIPGGTFTMGGDPNTWDPTPAHRVTLSAFKMAWSPVTIQDFQRFVESPHRADPKLWHAGGHTLAYQAPSWWEEQKFHPNCPVIFVTWYEAMAYVAWANAFEGPKLVPEGWRMALPTEAQWEYAARGPTGRIYPWGDDGPKHGDDPHANVEGIFYQGYLKPSPVGAYPRGHTPPQPFASGDERQGLSDVVGNVWEWCLDDWRNRDVYWEAEFAADKSGTPLSDPCYPADRARALCSDKEPHAHKDAPNPKASEKVLRGSSWLFDLHSTHCAGRGKLHPANESNHVGFRVCWVLVAPTPPAPR